LRIAKVNTKTPTTFSTYPLGQARLSRFAGHRGVVPDRREHPRHRRVRRAADQPAGRRAHHGAAGDDRRVPPLVGGAHHGGDSVLRLRAAGPQGQAARADLGQARGEHPERGRHEPRADDGPAQGADPGVLRHPGGPPVRGAGHHRLPGAAAVPGHHDRVAGRRRRRARARLRQAAGRRSSRSSTSAASPEDGHAGGDERHRRGRRAAPASSRTTSSTRAGTMQNAAQALMANGAERVLGVRGARAAARGRRIQRIEQSAIEKFIVTNTIPLPPTRRACKKLVTLSVARLLGQAIRSIHEETFGVVVVRLDVTSDGRGPGPRARRREARTGSMEARLEAVKRDTIRQERGAPAAREGPRCPRCSTAASTVDGKPRGDADRGGPEGAAWGSCARESGVNTLIGLKVGSEDVEGPDDASIQVDPLTRQPAARGLLPRSRWTSCSSSRCRSRVKGEAKGVKQQGGLLDFVHREIEIECLPADIPEHIELDVTELMLGPGHPPARRGHRARRGRR
ncbi:MAG: hypothetical protein MZV63_56600, partial [Marinilabiliales bacterium]|nr:hypothetical protein [Marinilabiliales bacterium]